MKIVKAKVVSEKPAPVKDVVIKGDPKKYYFYQVTNINKKGIFRKKRTCVIEYTQMDTDKVSFTLPPRKSVRICAVEGSVKAIRGRATIVKKELCVTDTPIPKFIKPKVRDDIKPTREQQDILDNLPDIDRIKEDIKIDFAGMGVRFSKRHL